MIVTVEAKEVRAADPSSGPVGQRRVISFDAVVISFPVVPRKRYTDWDGPSLPYTVYAWRQR